MQGQFCAPAPSEALFQLTGSFSHLTSQSGYNKIGLVSVYLYQDRKSGLTLDNCGDVAVL